MSDTEDNRSDDNSDFSEEEDEEEVIDELPTEELEEEEGILEETEEKKISQLIADKKLETVYIIVPKDKRRTSNFLTQYERASVLNTRATQIAKFGNAMYESDNSDVAKIAEDELNAGRCPLIVVREVGRVLKDDSKMYIYVEHWSMRELNVGRAP